jgi:hypothetical protein
MKKLLSLMVMALMVMPMVFAVSVDNHINPEITVEEYTPTVSMCHRGTHDDLVETQLYDAPRFNNYAFTGEALSVFVLAMDKNGIDKISDVYATVGDTQGEGNPVEVNCVRTPITVDPYNDCETQILEEEVAWNPDLMAVYECRLTVEENMEGEYWITVEAEDYDGNLGTMAQSEYWFLNPVIALSIDGDLTFEDVRPGARSYSSTLLVGNDAEDGSGVLLDMYIAGTDFTDSSSYGTLCMNPTTGVMTNQLSLDAFTYDAVNGQFAIDDAVIKHGDRLDQAGRIMDMAGPTFGEILGHDLGPNPTNFLAPGAEIAITFQLDMPEPCNGAFDEGTFYFFGEAI